MCMSRRYASDTHQVTTVAIRSEQMCNYDLDDMDLRWLSAVNGERALMGATTISELEMEKGIEDFEKQCYEKINITLRNNEAQEDQDDSIICDVCRSVITNTVLGRPICNFQFETTVYVKSNLVIFGGVELKFRSFSR